MTTAIPDEVKAELLRASVGIRQAWLAGGLADHLAQTAMMRAAQNRQERMADAVNAKAFGVEGTNMGGEEEMIVVNVGDTTISYPQNQPPPQPEPVSIPSAPAPASGLPSVLAKPLEPLSKLAKAGIVAAVLAGGGGIAATAIGLYEGLKPSPAASDTDTQYDLELVPNEPTNPSGGNS